MPIATPEIIWAQDKFSIHIKVMVAGARDCAAQVVDGRKLVFTCLSNRSEETNYRVAFTLEHEVEAAQYAPRVEDKYVRLILHKKKIKNEWSRLGEKASGVSMTYDWDLERALELQNESMGLAEEESDGEGDTCSSDDENAQRKPLSIQSSRTTPAAPASTTDAAKHNRVEQVTVVDKRRTTTEQQRMTPNPRNGRQDNFWIVIAVGLFALCAGILIGRLSAM